MRKILLCLLCTCFQLVALTPQLVPIHSGPYSENISKESDTYETYCNADAIVVLDKENGQLLRHFSFPGLFSANFSHDKYIVAISRLGDIAIFDIASGKLVERKKTRRDYWFQYFFNITATSIEYTFYINLEGIAFQSFKVDFTKSSPIITNGISDSDYLFDDTLAWRELLELPKNTVSNIFDDFFSTPAVFDTSFYSNKGLAIKNNDAAYSIQNGQFKKLVELPPPIPAVSDVSISNEIFSYIKKFEDYIYSNATVRFIASNDSGNLYWVYGWYDASGSYAYIYQLDQNRRVTKRNGFYFYYDFSETIFNGTFWRPLIIDDFILISTYSYSPGAGNNGNTRLIPYDINSSMDSDLLLKGGFQTINMQNSLIATSTDKHNHYVYSFSDIAVNEIVHIASDHTGFPIAVDKNFLYILSEAGIHAYSIKSAEYAASFFINAEGQWHGLSASGYTYSNSPPKDWLYLKVGKSLFRLNLLTPYFENSQEYLKGILTPEVSSVNPMFDTFVQVTANMVFITDQASNSGKRLAIQKQGDALFVTEKQDNWCKVVTPGGIFGWVPLESISTED